MSAIDIFEKLKPNFIASSIKCMQYESDFALKLSIEALFSFGLNKNNTYVGNNENIFKVF